MTRYREDGSVESINNPVWDNRFVVRDFGIYRGIIKEVLYTDSETNSTSNEKSTREVTYIVQLMGGTRDGHLLHNCRVSKSLGGIHNYEEIILKATKGATALDTSSLAANGDPNLRNSQTWNGDCVYVQFLDGSLTLPIITGLAKHPGNKESEATKEDGQRYRDNFNGISKEIDKDGKFSWLKQNGSYNSSVMPNSKDPLTPYFNEFVPDELLGKDAVSLTIGNDFDVKFALNTDFAIEIDGKADTLGITTKGGSNFLIDGSADSFEFTTNGGASTILDGSADKWEMVTNGGATITADGKGDKIALKTSAGDSLEMTKGVTITDSNGNKIVMSSSGIKLTESSGAGMNLSKGKVAIGGAAAEVVDLLSKTLEALGQATYSGFGSPASNVAMYIQLKAQLDAIKGSL